MNRQVNKPSMTTTNKSINIQSKCKISNLQSEWVWDILWSRKQKLCPTSLHTLFQYSIFLLKKLKEKYIGNISLGGFRWRGFHLVQWIMFCGLCCGLSPSWKWRYKHMDNHHTNLVLYNWLRNLVLLGM